VSPLAPRRSASLTQSYAFPCFAKENSRFGWNGGPSSAHSPGYVRVDVRCLHHAVHVHDDPAPRLQGADLLQLVPAVNVKFTCAQWWTQPRAVVSVTVDAPA
jgi:hypothetical protein